MIGCIVTHHASLIWKTVSNMMMAKDVPRYIVPQKMPTPIRHMTVAISVAYGIRVTHD